MRRWVNRAPLLSERRAGACALATPHNLIAALLPLGLPVNEGWAAIDTLELELQLQETLRPKKVEMNFGRCFRRVAAGRRCHVSDLVEPVLFFSILPTGWLHCGTSQTYL